MATTEVTAPARSFTVTDPGQGTPLPSAARIKEGALTVFAALIRVEGLSADEYAALGLVYSLLEDLGDAAQDERLVVVPRRGH